MAGPVNRCYPLTLENMVEGPDVQMTLEPADVAVMEMESGRGNRYSAIRGPVSPTFFPPHVGFNPGKPGDPGRQGQTEAR